MAVATTPNPAVGLRVFMSTVASLAMFGAALFWPAGRLDWPQGWLYLALVVVNFAINLNYLRRVNPEVIESRTRLGPGTKRWDIIWSICFGPALFAIYVVAGLDAIRYEWTSMSDWLWPLGLALFLVGNLIFNWSMGVNPFFEKTVRIQTDRGHRVIDSGPYKYVRHPGYVGFFFGWCLAPPFLLGSWWALLPALLAMGGMAIRTALEDRTLRRELDGYREYAARVRYRLIPGIW